MKLLHKGLVLISVPLIFELVFAVGFGSLLKKSLDQLNRETHAKQVMAKADRIHVMLCEATVIMALNSGHPNASNQARYKSLWQNIVRNHKDLKKVAIDKTEARLLNGVGREIRMIAAVQKLTMLGPMSTQIPDGNEINPDVSSKTIDWYKNREQIKRNSATRHLIDYEQSLVKQSGDLKKEFSSQLSNFLIFGLCGDIALVGGLAIFFGGSVEKRLKNLMSTTRRLSKGEDLLPPLQGDDELAQSDVLLHDTATRLIEIQRFKKQLLGVVCHELKAPLTSIQVLLSLVASESGKVSPKAQDAVARAERSCTRLQIMVAELLDMEVMASGKVNLNRRSVNCAHLLETSADSVKGLAKGADLQLVIEADTKEASLDSDRMTQVLVNLLSNAIKFSPRGGLIIMRCSGTPESITFSVTDQGPGIPEDLHKSVFEAFSQGSQQPKSSRIKGTGLGLAISKTIVQAHGGTIRVQSVPGEGATFEVEIPTKLSTAPPDSAPPAANLSQKERNGFRFRIRQKGLVLIGVPLVAQLAFVGSLAIMLQQASELIEQQSTARKVATDSMEVLETMGDSAILSWLGRENEEVPKLYDEQEQVIAAALKKLQETCATHKEYYAEGQAISQVVSKISDMQEQLARQKIGSLGQELSVEERTRYQNYWTELAGYMDKLAARQENKETLSSNALNSIVANLDRVLVCGLLLNVLSAIGLTMFLTQNITKRIQLVQLNAQRLLTKESLLPPVSGSDEIADLDRAFHEAADTLTAEQQLKQQLLAIASHELRSPLTSIFTTLNMLSAGAMGELPDKTIERVAKAEVATERLISLINDILDIEKMEAGKFVLSVETVSLQEVVTRSIECIQPIASTKGVTVENLVCDEKILADPEKLSQALVNLLSNSIKFSLKNQTVRVTSNAEPQSDTITVSITDQGQGIPAELQSRIFERFESSKDEGRNATGTGLGLPVSKAIIEQHGGMIGFDSEENKGSRFWISIPCAPAEESSAGAISR